MSNFHLTVLSLATILWAQPGFAGPCTSEIDQAQAVIDKRLESIAATGATGTQTDAAQLHRQPTPGSIAAAEQKLGEGTSVEPAMAALAQARRADERDDSTGCNAAMMDVRRLLGP